MALIKNEQSERRLGLFFVLLMFAVQFFAVFIPPEQSLASNSGDTIPGGVYSRGQILKLYDSNNQDLQALTNYLGITRSDLLGLSERPSKSCEDKQTTVSF
ncbi:MAG TPA: hypothetical protein VNX65_04080, partial [Patescibacteria group bacterium]|nr:hypothetical protein [Patescibacteria group bacterium]